MNYYFCTAKSIITNSEAWPHGAMASVANPHATNAAIELLAIAQRLERTGDIAVSVAGNLIYLVEGRVVRHGAAD